MVTRPQIQVCEKDTFQQNRKCESLTRLYVQKILNLTCCRPQGKLN